MHGVRRFVMRLDPIRRCPDFRDVEAIGMSEIDGEAVYDAAGLLTRMSLTSRTVVAKSARSSGRVSKTTFANIMAARYSAAIGTISLKIGCSPGPS